MEVIAGSSRTIGGNVWDISVIPAKPKTSGTIYALVQLRKSGDADDGKYWDTTAGGSWQASPAAWPTATYSNGSWWAYAVPAAATTGKSGSTIVLVDLTDHLTPASSTVSAGGMQQLDVVSEDRLVAADLPSEPPSASAVASQVRTELATELGRIDAAVTTRAAPSDVPSASTVAEAVADQTDIAGVISAVVGTATLDSRASAVGAPLQAADYTAPDNATIGTIASDVTDGFAADIDAIDEAVQEIIAEIPTAVGVASQVRTELAIELARVDATVSSRLAAAGYTAPDNATIGAINTKIGTPAASVSEDIADAQEALEAAIAAISGCAEPAGLYTLTIDPVDDEDARLAGVVVSVLSTDLDPLWREVSSGAAALTLAVDTGNYILRVSKPGYAPAVASAALAILGDTSVSPVLTADSAAPPMCTIYGTLTGPEGPLEGETVTLVIATPSEGGGYSYGGEVSTETDDAGYFEVTAPQGSQVTVTIMAIGWDHELRTVPSSVSRSITGWSA
jgi:hypothetical protein